eukprot:5524224-Alexandrium_andersonii.AAC.1
MSASLVGSEMCIRDRGSPLCKLRPQLPPQATATRLAAMLTGPTSTSEPVSYTHLTLPTICSV